MTKDDTTTIRIYNDTRDILLDHQKRPNDSYDDAIHRILEKLEDE